VTPGERLAALPGNRFVLRDGVPLAVHAAGEVSFLASLALPEEWSVRSALLRRASAISADQAVDSRL
jgi:ATP-dependent Lhr-like helicase